MKPTLSTITLFFFLFTFSTKSSPVTAAMPEPVVDISGKKLKAGMSYYILPAFRGRGGGLSFDTFGNDTCPHVVVQERSELSKGKPVQFLPANPKNRVVHTSRNLNIKFSERISTCVESGVWKKSEIINEAWHVGTNGIARNQEYVYWFMIKKAELEGVYKLKFSPWSQSAVCNDELGIFAVGDDGKRYVGLANPGQFQTLRVVFQKANVKNDINDDADAVMSI